MGFFNKLFGSKKETVSNDNGSENIDFNNVKKGNVVTFPPLYDTDTEQFSGKNASVVEIHTIKDEQNKEKKTWIHLYEDNLIIEKQNNTVKIFREIEDLEDLTSRADMDILSEVLTLDEHEMEGKEIQSEDKQIVIKEDFSMMKGKTYFISHDMLVNSSKYGKDVRFIEAKTSNRKNVLHFFVLPHGDTYVFEGVVVDAEGFEIF